MHVPLNDLRRVHAPHQSRFATLMTACSAVAFSCWVPRCGRSSSVRRLPCTGHCAGVANGSDALEIALRAVGVEAGDTVATVANAAMYATLAIRAIGAIPGIRRRRRPHAHDVPVRFRRDCNASLRAVVVTHLYGRLADMAPILAAASKAKLAVVEDCAQAHGAARDGTRAGARTAACFSFYPTKNLGALGDGGAITTSDPAVADRVRALRQYGWSSKYCVSSPAGGTAVSTSCRRPSSTHGCPPSIARTRAAARSITRTPMPSVMRRSACRCAGERGACGAPRRRSHGRRESLRAHLDSRGVATDVHYPIADHRQPVFDERPPPALPITERACDEVLSLPCFPA